MIDFNNGSIIKLKKASTDSAREVLPLLINGENIVSCYKGVRDFCLLYTSSCILLGSRNI